MSARFTETEKWSDPWFQSLPHGSKLLFMYFCDRCNMAGFYEENQREACFHLGIDTKQYEGALKGLERGIKGASGWYWIRNFLKHQKNANLKHENPAHRAIIRMLGEQLERFGECSEFQAFIAPYKGLLRPIGNSKGKGSKEEVQEEDDHFPAFWDTYPKKVGRADAVKAWNKLKCNSKPTVVLNGLCRCVASEEWHKENGKFIPHPATWLNREGWNDELTPHRNGSVHGYPTAAELRAKQAALDAEIDKRHANQS